MNKIIIVTGATCAAIAMVEMHFPNIEMPAFRRVAEY
jgi:hypothetical protein